MKTKFFAVLVVGILLIIGVLFLLASGQPFYNQWLDNLNPFKLQPKTITIAEAIITDIKQVSTLTTTIFTIQQVFEKGDKSGLAWWHVIMVVKGTVEAGIDLEQLDASDVSVSDDGKSITVNLPPVIILTEREHILSSNSEDTYRYDSGSWLWVNPPNFDDVETELRGKTGDQILETACNNGILRDATDDAKVTIELFLKITKPNINITIVSAPVPTVEECKAK